MEEKWGPLTLKNIQRKLLEKIRELQLIKIIFIKLMRYK